VIALPRAGDPSIGITGVGAYLPERVVGSGEVGVPLGVTADWIVERSGVRERRIAGADQAASDLAVPAARMALERAGRLAAEIDLVIVATATPDMPFPATATLVADAIGATPAVAYDLSAASTGFVYAAAQAWAAVASGLASRALVIGAEVLSRVVDWSDRDTAILFGDAAAAVVVEPVADGGFLGFELGADGAGASDILLPAGGSRRPASAETVAEGLHTTRMNGQAVYRFSNRATPESVARLLEACGLTAADVDHYAPHQSNRRIIDSNSGRIGIPPERVLVNVERVGNTSSASIPLVLAEADQAGRLGAGDTVLTSAVGAGLTWGSALLRWTQEGGGA
jgi:3-oxoacyl-[acyl-carrier-protein] synthase III